jgi:hypothetical protein
MTIFSPFGILALSEIFYSRNFYTKGFYAFKNFEIDTQGIVAFINFETLEFWTLRYFVIRNCSTYSSFVLRNCNT